MEYTKKMMLVPQEFFNKLKNQKEELQNVTGDLESEMKAVLYNNDTMDERVKWAQYQQLLQRYLHFKENERKPLQVTFDENEQVTPTPKLYNEILESVPKLFKKKAQLLLQRLSQSDGIIWNDLGEVTIKGKPLVGSSITDLVGDVIRSRKNTNPTGWQEFAGLLRDINTPREFIGNPRRLAFIERGAVVRPVLAKPHTWQRRVQARKENSQRNSTPRRSTGPFVSSDDEVPLTSWERYKL